MDKPTYTKQEREVVFLSAVLGILNDCLNRSMIELRGDPESTLVYFHTSAEHRLFSILLADLLSESDAHVTGERKYHLKALRQIADSPSF